MSPPRTCAGWHRPYLHRHAEHLRRGDTLAYSLDDAGAPGRDAYRRTSPVADHIHPLCPAVPAGPDAGELAALLRALERADPGADRSRANRPDPSIGSVCAACRGYRQTSVFTVFGAAIGQPVASAQYR